MRALVIEGGGSRAAFAHGTLAAFEAADHRDFDAVYGTSAGGALAAWFSARQARYAVDLWRRSDEGEYVSMSRWMTRRGPWFDHDRLFREVYRVELNVDTLRAASHPVVVTAANVETGETTYFDLREGDPFDRLRATGRLPLGAGGPVEIDGQHFLDGGMTDPIPLQRAIDDGADEIVCLMNRPPGERSPEPWLSRMLVGARYPALRDAWDRHHVLHNEAVSLAEAPPGGVHVDVVRPSGPTGVGRMTTDASAILDAVHAGEQAGVEYLQARGVEIEAGVARYTSGLLQAPGE